MGSPLSPVIAGILKDLEAVALRMILVHISFYLVKYIDDIALPDLIDLIQKIFNSFHNRLHFTVERSTVTTP